MKWSLFCLLFLTVSCGFEVVDTGRRGIETNMGKVVGEPLPEGLHFYNPFTSNISEINVREESHNFELTAYSKDNQQISIVVNIVAAPVANKVGDIFKQYGDDFFDPIAKPVIISSVKDIIGQFTADTIISQRRVLQSTAYNHAKEKLIERHISVTGVEFSDIKFQPEYEQAVEAKVVATQRAEEAKNKTDQIREEKEQSILRAQAEAESIKIKSQALSQNAKLVELEAVQKWNGVLPQYMMGNSVPFLKLGN